ncbi:MAG: hypothetical protein COB85_06845 [Bacteroidetes bacterium]|nr:MAG: hypothetical protein COB85_06845 [Bacteroidota bacterium]
MVLYDVKRPCELSFNLLVQRFDYTKYQEEDIKQALLALIENEFIIVNDDGKYTFTREQFLNTRSHFQIQVYFQSPVAWSIIPLTAAAFAFIMAASTLIDRFDTASDIKAVTGIVEKGLENLIITEPPLGFEQLVNLDELPDDSLILKELWRHKEQMSTISKNLEAINTMISDNPTKVIELNKLQGAVKILEKKLDASNESLKREIDKISSYNNTIIIFMISFIAFMGIGLFNIYKQKREP